MTHSHFNRDLQGCYTSGWLMQAGWWGGGERDHFLPCWSCLLRSTSSPSPRPSSSRCSFLRFPWASLFPCPSLKSAFLRAWWSTVHPHLNCPAKCEPPGLKSDFLNEKLIGWGPVRFNSFPHDSDALLSLESATWNKCIPQYPSLYSPPSLTLVSLNQRPHIWLQRDRISHSSA